MRAISRYSTLANTRLENTADLDLNCQSGSIVVFGTMDNKCAVLLKKLNYKESQTFDDIHSGASAITGGRDHLEQVPYAPKHQWALPCVAQWISK